MASGVSLTQALQWTQEERAHLLAFLQLLSSICVGGCQHDLLPLAIAQKVLAKLLSRLGATEQGRGAQLPMLLQWPFQSLKEEGLGVCRPSQKYALEGTF